MTRTNKRVAYWDNIKFILIFLVALGHFLYSRDDLRLVRILTLTIYSFHMEAFAFISGYFSKSNHSRSKEALIKLGTAYFLFNGIFVIYAALRGSEVMLIHPYYSFWYLLALIAWRLTVGYIAQFRYGFLISLALSLAVGFWPDAGNALAFGRTIAFYPFFLAGYLMPTNIGERLSAIKAKGRIIVGGIVALVALLAVLGSYVVLHYNSADVLMDPYGSMRSLIVRLGLFAVSIVVIVALLLATPNVHIPLVTTIGKNSFAVYIIHRYIVLIFDRVLAQRLGTIPLIAVSVVVSLVVLGALGNNFIGPLIDSFVDEAAGLVLAKQTTKPYGKFARMSLVGIVALTVLTPVLALRRQANTATNTTPALANYPRLSTQEQSAQDNSFTILFAGDLTLLEDQVKNAYTGEGYDFSPMFEYTAPYIQAADLAIGVLEGPLGGQEFGYSTGNYDDGKTFNLNFPDEFADAIKEAGFDLVTCADNHLLDAEEGGALRTISVLDRIGLDHTGSYKSESEKNTKAVKIIEMQGLKIAILSYTYGVNADAYTDYPNDVFFGGKYEYLTSIIADPTSSAFAESKARVEADFTKAKEQNPDIIVVLPHWGTQFAYAPDEFQTTWRQIFLDLGADIILGAHTHTVQPTVMEEVGGKLTFTAYCPGNYTNIYRGSDSDAASLIEVHIDRSTKEVVGAAVIPMWTQSALSGNYRPLPLFDILNNHELSQEITTYDLERIREINSLITSTMLGKNLSLQMVRPRYEIDANGFKRSPAARLEITDEIRKGTFYKLLEDVYDVCFVGDSITTGDVNGGYAWYEPIEWLVRGKVSNVSRDGATSSTLLDMTGDMIAADADLYVVAIGANDVRLQDPASADAYIANLQQLVDTVKKTNADAHFAFIAPWTSTDGDYASVISYQEKLTQNELYTDALRDFCSKTGSVFINPNKQIKAVLDLYPRSNYLLDCIHPNSTTGIELYAEAVMKG